MIPNFKRWMSFSAISAVVAAVLSPAAAHAVLVHRYTFNANNANDSAGTSHGSIANPAGAQFINGALVVTANAGQLSNAISSDSYVDLPNGVISQAAQSGPSGALS